MDFQTAIRTCLNKYTEFQGRAQRSEYWWFALFSVLAQLAGTVIDIVVFGSDTGMVAFLTMAGLLLPTLAVSIRRLHDQDRTGWWVLIILVPFIGSIALIVLMILKGTDGPNRFGPDPLDPQEEEIRYSATNIPNVQDND